jgi:uncharacterized protein YcgI (DUF1989 family)
MASILTEIGESLPENGIPLGRNMTLTAPISADGSPELGRIYTLPARQGRAVRVKKDQAIRIANPSGTQVCDFWAFSDENPSEYLSWEHTRGAINSAMPKVGDTLVTNRRRPILTFEKDTSPGIHDTLIAACDLFRYEALGCADYHDNCSDNMRMALLSIGAIPAEVPQPFNIWMNIPVNRDWSISWLPPVSAPGDFVVLRAKLDMIAVMSACPQDMVPINGADMTPMDLEFTVLA